MTIREKYETLLIACCKVASSINIVEILKLGSAADNCRLLNIAKCTLREAINNCVEAPETEE